MYGSEGVKKNIKACRKPELDPDEEIIVCEVEGPKYKNVAIIVLYRPPSSDLACFSRAIEYMLVKASKEYEIICKMGDFLSTGKVNSTPVTLHHSPCSVML